MSSERAENSERILMLTHFAIEWKIPDIFPVKAETIKSPDFECFGAEWHIDLIDVDGVKFCDVVKTHNVTTDFDIDIVVGIKNIDETVCTPRYYTVSMKEPNSFGNMGPIVGLSDLLRDKMMIAPQGTLVVLCHLTREKKYHGRFVIPEASTQAEKINRCQLCKSKFRIDSGHAKIPEQTIVVTHFAIEWKIADFFSVPEEDKRSPEFECFGAKWAIDLFHRNGIWKCKIARTEHSYSGFCAHYVIGVRRINGAVYKSTCGTVHMTDPSHFGFEGNFLRSCDLLENKLTIAPRNTLVVFCSFRLKEEQCETVIPNTRIKAENANRSIKTVEDSSHRSDDGTSDGEKVSPRLEGVHKLVEDLKELFINGTNFDATIKIGDREFRAHRTILAARLPAFEAMFRLDTVERNTGVVEIEDCDPDAFHDFLLFLYSGNLDILSDKNFLHLYTLADKYDVQDLKRKCLQFATQALCVDNFCDVVVLALTHGESQLLKFATTFFAKNTKKIISSVKWQCFLKKHPIECNELHLKAIECRDDAS